MENIDRIIEKLMLNRTKLMLNRFDNEFKQIIGGDLQSFKSAAKLLTKRSNRNQMRIA